MTTTQNTSKMVTPIVSHQHAKRIVQLESRLETTYKHLKYFLDEFEGAWGSDEKCESPEAAMAYIEAADWAAKAFGRTNNCITAVQEWYDNYLPFNNGK